MRWLLGTYVGGRGAVGLLIVRLVFGHFWLGRLCMCILNRRGLVHRDRGWMPGRFRLF